MAKAYKSKILEAVHDMMEGAFDAGVIDQKTMREFDESCLTKVEPLAPAEIAALRKREDVSQAVLARHLYVSTKLVGEWERGEKKPSGPSLKLLTLVKAKGLAAIA